ncbi:MAG: hypothetical protein KME42_13840 [Tildeniella nuda ZEHNDER 1965/U140]|jgi:hypothetical protein|nr:hypothetical protein [Tildeniella nuda ZEHNDER 1965/U140]
MSSKTTEILAVGTIATWTSQAAGTVGRRGFDILPAKANESKSIGAAAMSNLIEALKSSWQQYPQLAEKPKCPLCGIPAIIHLASSNVTDQIEIEKLIENKGEVEATAKETCEYRLTLIKAELQDLQSKLDNFNPDKAAWVDSDLLGDILTYLAKANGVKLP